MSAPAPHGPADTGIEPACRWQPAVLCGQVMHRRPRGPAYRFEYPLFWLRLPLNGLAREPGWLCAPWLGLERWAPLVLRRHDHGPRDGSDLLAWARALLARFQVPADGEVVLETTPRFFGLLFNPVSFWYCHDQAGALRAVLCQVHNTFGEWHTYVAARPDRGPIGPGEDLEARKVFHVSPFFPVGGSYRFRFALTAAGSQVWIRYEQESSVHLVASLRGEARPLGRVELGRALLGAPVQAAAVLFRIHWQALRLWARGAVFHRKPEPPRQEVSS